MAHIADLYRYPIKGLSPEKMASLTLLREHGIPFDREYALALGTTAFDPDHPEPLDKGFFLMLRNNEALAALSTRFDPATRHSDHTSRRQAGARGRSFKRTRARRGRDVL